MIASKKRRFENMPSLQCAHTALPALHMWRFTFNLGKSLLFYLNEMKGKKCVEMQWTEGENNNWSELKDFELCSFNINFICGKLISDSTNAIPWCLSDIDRLDSMLRANSFGSFTSVCDFFLFDFIGIQSTLMFSCPKHFLFQTVFFLFYLSHLIWI